MLESFAEFLQTLPVAVLVSENIFPEVEAAHVVALALFFGTLAIVDLRLVGLTSRHMRFTQIHDQVLPISWFAFVLAAITGGLMFVANASSYIHNTPLIIKFVLLALAGVNMAYFQFVTFRGVAAWDNGEPAAAAKLGGYLSLGLWVGIITCGRLAGFV
ncbi:MAG: hypothetical protein NT064_09080 [Proteobacteria bacterium]|nr:hypothetical protein [Pseudomonadota bacterium]